MEATEEREKPKYLDKFHLLNKCETELYFRLVEAMPKLIVLSQVSMSQLFFLKGKDSYLKVNEIGKKSLDFLVCRQDFSIVAAIELNGPTHEKEVQKKRDEKKRAALEEAGIPLMVYYPDELPDVAEIRRGMAPLIVERREYESEKREQIDQKRAEAQTEGVPKKRFWGYKKKG